MDSQDGVGNFKRCVERRPHLFVISKFSEKSILRVSILGRYSKGKRPALKVEGDGDREEAIRVAGKGAGRLP